MIALARDYGTITAGGDPRQLRHAAPRRRRQRRARRRLPAGARRRVARSGRRRAAVDVGHLSGRCRGARASRPDPRDAAHDQHEHDRRRARSTRRSADSRDLRLQLESGRRRARVGARSRPASRATISSASCTRSSRPTPPTTPTSCCRRRRSSSSSTSTRSYGHLYALANNPSIAPLGEAKPNTEVFRLLARADGLHRAVLSRQRRRARAAGVRRATIRARPASTGTTLKQRGFQRLARARDVRAVRQGGFPTPSGKCELYSATLAREGHDPLPTFIPPRESVASNPALAARYPLAFISPPARNFLNSSFANLPAFVAEEKAPRLDIHPDDARAREHRDRRSRAHLQRSRELLGHGARHRPRATRRRRRAVDLVEEALAGRRERERRDGPGADRPRPRGDVLRLPGRSRANLSVGPALMRPVRACARARPSRRRSRACLRDGSPGRPCSRASARTGRASTSSRFSVNWLSTIATTMSPRLADGRLLDDDEIAFEDAGVHHRIALDPDQHRLRRALDQVVVDRQRVGLGVVDRVRAGPPAPATAPAAARRSGAWARAGDPASSRGSRRASAARPAPRPTTSTAGRAARRSTRTTAARDAGRNSPAAASR